MLFIEKPQSNAVAFLFSFHTLYLATTSLRVNVCPLDKLATTR